MEPSSEHTPSARIVVVGCPLSGKRTTLSSLLGIRANADVAYELPTREAGTTKVYVRIVPLLTTNAKSSVDTLMEADGYLVVLDSQHERAAANAANFEKLSSELRDRGRNIDTFPIVFQLNKRDLPTAESVESLRARFASRTCAYLETIAPTRKGVLEAVETLLRLIADHKTPA